MVLFLRSHASLAFVSHSILDSTITIENSSTFYKRIWVLLYLLLSHKLILFPCKVFPLARNPSLFSRFGTYGLPCRISFVYNRKIPSLYVSLLLFLRDSFLLNHSHYP